MRLNPQHGVALGHLAWVRYAQSQAKPNATIDALIAATKLAPDNGWLM